MALKIKGYKNNIKSIQIPIVYKQRVGESSVTGDFRKAFGLGISSTLGSRISCIFVRILYSYISNWSKQGGRTTHYSCPKKKNFAQGKLPCQTPLLAGGTGPPVFVFS